MAQNVKSQCQNVYRDSAQAIGEGHSAFVDHLVILFEHGLHQKVNSSDDPLRYFTVLNI